MGFPVTLPDGTEGWVKYHHLRLLEGDADRQYRATSLKLKEIGCTPSSKGGLTQADLELPDGTMIVGLALCSDKDNFDKTKGRLIAAGRAITRWKLWSCGGEPAEGSNLGRFTSVVTNDDLLEAAKELGL